jgi:antirestriction protein ArdC
MPTQTELRRDITDKIVAAFEKDTVPWRRPWGVGQGRHRNVVSRKPYSGINPLLLQLHALNHGFNSPLWATFDQWKELGCAVKKRPANVGTGKWGCRIVFFKPIAKMVKDEKGDEKENQFLVMRTFTVFNAEQVGGEAAEKHRQQPKATAPDFAPAEELIVATKADIRHGGGNAFYRLPTPEGSWPNLTGGDTITLPPMASFNPAGAYYETALHELCHWSEPRLGWDRKGEGYAMGELIAEMASCFTASEMGVPQGESLDNHAA